MFLGMIMVFYVFEKIYFFEIEFNVYSWNVRLFRICFMIIWERGRWVGIGINRVSYELLDIEVGW